MVDPNLWDMVLAVGGFFGVTTIGGIITKQSSHGKVLAELPKQYVQKEDYREDMRDIKADLKEVLRRLEEKEDRR